MVDYQTKFRDKLQTKLFDRIGKSVTFKKITSPLYNTRGELESQTSTSSTVTIVPYNIMFKENNFQPFGTLANGEMDAAVPYTVNVDKDDLFTIDSVEWKVVSVEKNYLPENVVTIIRLARVQA